MEYRNRIILADFSHHYNKPASVSCASFGLFHSQFNPKRQSFRRFSVVKNISKLRLVRPRREARKQQAKLVFHLSQSSTLICNQTYPPFIWHNLEAPFSIPFLTPTYPSLQVNIKTYFSNQCSGPWIIGSVSWCTHTQA